MLDGVELCAARYMVDNLFVEVAGKRVKLMLDLMLGCVMVWGGMLVVWGILGLILMVCKMFGIYFIGDVMMVMKRVFTSYANLI